MRPRPSRSSYFQFFSRGRAMGVARDPERFGTAQEGPASSIMQTRIQGPRETAEQLCGGDLFMLTDTEKKCSMFRSSLSRRRAAHAFSRHPLFLAAVCAPLWLGAVQRVAAQEDPPGCTFAGAGALIQPDPSGAVTHGDTICYDVCYSVPDGNINSCNVINFDADLFFPDGSSINTVSGASIDRAPHFAAGLTSLPATPAHRRTPDVISP